MEKKREFDFLDYLLLIVDKKKLFAILTVLFLGISYLSIYFFIPAQYDSKALIVSSESDQVGGLASLVKSFSNLPVSIPGLKSGTNTDVFKTIIYSRSNLEAVISKFGLFKEYGYDTMQETIKDLAGNIKADETKEGAFEIIFRHRSPQKAADVVNFLVEKLNKSLVELNVSKSHDNRIFLENRYNEIRNNLKMSEDSLVLYQRKSGIFYAEDQAKASFQAYSKLEADLASKQIEFSILSKLYGSDSPQVSSAKLSVSEYEKKLNGIKEGSEKNSFILALKNLPENAMKYLRYYRDVEIGNKMLVFIIPLYEQSKFEEHKDIPVLKIIDKAIPAQKKAYPQRLLLSLLFSFIGLLGVFTFMVIRNKFVSSTNPKVNLLMKNFLILKKSNK
jgi:tyrosine-protein kinase Etk/Wzc